MWKILVCKDRERAGLLVKSIRIPIIRNPVISVELLDFDPDIDYFNFRLSESCNGPIWDLNLKTIKSIYEAALKIRGQYTEKYPDKLFDDDLLSKQQERIGELEECLWEFIRRKDSRFAPSEEVYQRAEKLLGVVITSNL